MKRDILYREGMTQIFHINKHKDKYSMKLLSLYVLRLPAKKYEMLDYLKIHTEIYISPSYSYRIGIDSQCIISRTQCSQTI